jgi:hypothetical protein
MDIMTINGEPVEVPADLLEKSRAVGLPDGHAYAKWFAEQDAPHAKAKLQASGLKAGEVTCTGFGGAMLTSDVERAIQARDEAKAAKAAPAETKAAPADTPQEG